MKMNKNFFGVLPPIALFALVFALFSPSLRYRLVDLDDYAYINQNRIVLQGLSPDTVRAAFSPSNTTATMYMPLLWISYMADVTFFHASPEHPAPFHAVNVVLHAFSSILLYVLLRRLRASPLWAFLLSLLWAVHPLRVESVAWVTERKDTLAAFFGLAATLCYLKASRTPSEKGLHPRETESLPRPAPLGFRLFFLVCAAAFYALGLLAKPSLVPLPLAWMAFDLWPLCRFPSSPRTPGFVSAAFRAAAGKLLFLPLALVAAWMAVAQHHAVSGALAIPWRWRLAAVAPNFLFYIRKTILPLRLSPLVPEQWHFAPFAVILSLAVCGALAATVWIYRKSLPSLLPGAVWTLLFFLPASGLQPLPMNTVADRFFYLPSIGLSLAFATLRGGYAVGSVPGGTPKNDWGAKAPMFSRSSLLPPVILALLLIPLAVLSSRILPHWASSDTLYRRVASVFPRQPLAVSHLAESAIKSSGNFAEAEAILAPALAGNPEAWALRLPQADCLLHRVSPDAAIDYLLRSRMPDDLHTSATIFFYLANYEFFRGDFDTAIRYAERSLSSYAPDSTARSPVLCLALGAAFEAGNSQQALAFARQTRMFSGATAVSVGNLLPLAIFHWTYGYRDQASALLFRILDAAPGDTTLWNNILWGLATAAWSPVPPSEVLDRTLRMQAASPFPEHPGILDTLAAAQANAGDFDSALRSIQHALDLAPEAETTFRDHLLARKALYQSRMPYREKAFDRLFSSTFGSPAEAL